MASRKEREEFLSVLQDELTQRVVNERVKPAEAVLSRAQVLEAGRLLLRHARTHGHLACEECNGLPDQWHRWVQQGTWTQAKLSAAIDERAAWIKLRQERVAKRIREVCAELGLKVELGGDPRGYTVKLHFPSGRYNTMGGRESGYGVPQ